MTNTLNCSVFAEMCELIKCQKIDQCCWKCPFHNPRCWWYF